MPTEYSAIPWRTTNWIIKNFESVPLDEIKAYLQAEFSNYYTYDSNQKSNFRRLVSLYDLFMYKK